MGAWCGGTLPACPPACSTSNVSATCFCLVCIKSPVKILGTKPDQMLLSIRWRILFQQRTSKDDQLRRMKTIFSYRWANRDVEEKILTLNYYVQFLPFKCFIGKGYSVYSVRMTISLVRLYCFCVVGSEK